jgi:hypothetical protein
MNEKTPPTPKAAAIWYLWSSAFNMSMKLEPRWVGDEEPYAVQFPTSYESGDFVRLSEVEAEWLIGMKTRRVRG